MTHALEAVADLDPHPSLVGGDGQDDAVVEVLVSDLPCLCDADRIVLDG
jgi:hypothetical protein